MDTNLITEIADIQAIKKNIEAVIALTDTALKGLKKEASQSIDFKGLAEVAKNVEKVTAARKSQKAVLSELEKVELAIKKTDEFTLQNKFKIEELLSKEVNTIAELTAQNKALENVRKNLDFTDKNYEKTQSQIIAKENENIAKIKEFQTVEQQRTSGIGKYEEAIKSALSTDGNYKTQLLSLKNTMASLEIEKEKAIKTYGAESKEVKALTEQYDILEKKAGDVTDKQGDMQARIKYLADDYGKFKAVLSGVQAVMGAVSVGKGFLSLLGIESSSVEKATQKLAALIATMQGLKTLQETLNKDNYFMQFLKQIKPVETGINKIKGFFKGLGTAIAGVSVIVAAFAAAIALGIKMISDNNKLHRESIELTEKRKKIIKEITEEERTHAKALKEINEKLQEQRALYQQVTAEFIAGQKTFAQYQGNLKLLTLENQIKALSEAYADFATKAMEVERHPFNPNYFLAYEEAKKKIIEIAIDTRNLSNSLADPKTANALEAFLNPETSEQGADSQLMTLNDLINQITVNYKRLQPVVKETTSAIESSVAEIKEAVKPISREEEDEMYAEYIEQSLRRMRGRVKKEVDVPPIQIEIPFEFEDPEVKELKSALEKFSDEVAKQIGIFSVKVKLVPDGGEVGDLKRISDSVMEVMSGLMDTSRQVLNNVVGNAIKMSNEEYNTRTQAAENEANIAKEALETSLLNEEDRAEAEVRIEKEKQRKLSDLKNEQAKKERDSQAAEIAINAVMAFASTLATAKGGMAAKLIQAAAVSAVTLSQLAVLYSKPLPKYEKGGVVGSETSVIAGEKGRELAFTPNNKVLMLDSKGIYNLPTGTIIKDNKTTEKILKEKNVNISVSRDYIEIDRQKYINKYLNKTI